MSVRKNPEIKSMRKKHGVGKEDIDRLPAHVKSYVTDLEDGIFDDLTRLPRRGFLEYEMMNHMSQLERDHKQSQKKPKEKFCSGMGFVHADIHKFKSINDTLGYGYGDKAIQAAADEVRKSVREADWKARWGGDELAVHFKVRGRNRPQVVEGLYIATVSLPIKAGVIAAEYGIEVPPKFSFINLDMGATIMDNSAVVEMLRKTGSKKKLLGEMNEYSSRAMKISKKSADRYRDKRFLCFWNPVMSEGESVPYIERAFSNNNVRYLDVSQVYTDGQKFILCAW